MPASDRRSSPRVAVEIGVRLARPAGAPVTGRTIDLGTGGMMISTARPLRVDEVLDFDLALDPGHDLAGQVRVMRQHPHNEYALRFEVLGATGSAALAGFVATH